MSNNCACKSWAGIGPESFGEHHHKNCPDYAVEKFPRIFYYEEAENCWAPTHCDIDCLFDASILEDGETIEIQFKRFDMTDKEFAEIPEC